MALTKDQKLGSICNQIAWLSLRERLVVLWALLTRRAS
jgi:hypothetical protein